MTMTSQIIPRDPVSGEIDEEWLAALSPEEQERILARFRKPVPPPSLLASLFKRLCG